MDQGVWRERFWDLELNISGGLGGFGEVCESMGLGFRSGFGLFGLGPYW